MLYPCPLDWEDWGRIHAYVAVRLQVPFRVDNAVRWVMRGQAMRGQAMQVMLSQVMRGRAIRGRAMQVRVLAVRVVVVVRVMLGRVVQARVVARVLLLQTQKSLQQALTLCRLCTCLRYLPGLIYGMFGV